jgi:type II secretory ATPase GspE/PulE/Tfp pilus assembly ATPase PilB-like protein
MSENGQRRSTENGTFSASRLGSSGFDASTLASGQDRASTFAVTFELLFHKQVQQLTQKIQAATDAVATVRAMADEICKVLNADRLSVFLTDANQKHLLTQMQLADGSTPDLKLPIDTKSIAGFVAKNKRVLNIANAYDDEALQRIHPDLRFLKAVDTKTGYRTRELLATPIMVGDKVLGVLQIVNSKNAVTFSKLELEGTEILAKTIASRIVKSQIEDTKDGRSHAAPVRTASKYAYLVQTGVLTEGDLQKLQMQSGADDAKLEEALASQHRLRSPQIGQSLSRFYGVPYEAYQSRRAKNDALHGSLRRDAVMRQGWVPLQEDADGGLGVLCLDPDAAKASRVVAQTYSRYPRINYRVCTQSEYKDTVEQLTGGGTGSIDQLLAQLGKVAEETERAEVPVNSGVADNEMVRLVNKVILDAYQMHASDIHIEPGIGGAKMLVRVRVDGSLEHFLELPSSLRHAMVARLKVMADLDISESRRPQDGKITFRKFGPLDIELRVATIPTSGGTEDVVMRILAGGEPIPMADLGLLEANKSRLLSVIDKPYGLFYVCGPTGSGKTTTLHSILAHLNTPDTKIWTAEDPVEITQRGLRQVQVNKKAGIDFATLMRAFLRADPDIIMVGESRDRETVAMGVEASLTGHMVFSTLHTNSAPESITRLLDMGMDPFNFADALLGILAQRLAKRLCTCKESYAPGEQELKSFMTEYAIELRHTEAWQTDANHEMKRLYARLKHQHAVDGKLRLYRPVGCPECRNTGYRGRIGLHELLVTDDKVKRLIQERARVSLIFTAAVEAGMHTLKMDGMEKALMGQTDLKQVRAVCIK